MAKNCLFIGRFQPFHNGHLQVVKGMVKVCDKVIVAIGSSQLSRAQNNPYTADERREMIQRALQATDIIPRYNVEIHEVPDCESNEEWVKKCKSVCGLIDEVWTADEVTKKCFMDAGIAVKEIKPIPGISATEIRRKMTANEVSWKDMVPESIVPFIQSLPTR